MPKQQKVMEILRRLPMAKKTCPTCEKEFWGPAIRKFCSPSCRNKAAYHRNPEAYRASRMRSYHKLKGEVLSHPAAGKKAAEQKSNFLK